MNEKKYLNATDVIMAIWDGYGCNKITAFGILYLISGGTSSELV